MCRTLIICLVVICFSSCKKLFIKPDETGETNRNFQIFWNDVNNSYPYFEEDNINWKDRYNEYSPKITSSTSIDELYTYMTQMLTGFSDGHLSVQYGKKSFANPKMRPNIAELVTEDGVENGISQNDVDYYYNFHNINKGYIDAVDYHVITASNGIANPTIDTVCIYGYRAVDQIVYINLASFLTEYRFDNLLADIFKAYPNSKGMILDLRMNGGGNLGIMWKALSLFVPSNVSEIKYAFNREKVGPLPQNYGAETYFAIEKNNFSISYNQPIVVLANRLSVSAAEHAVLAMREIKKRGKKIKIVGDYTFGATSFIVERTLPCGIQYTLVNNKTFDINHQVIEKTGVKPDEFSYLKASNISKGIDDQMVRALEIIKTDNFN